MSKFKMKKKLKIYYKNTLANLKYHTSAIYKLVVQYINQYLVEYPVVLVGNEWQKNNEATIGIFIGFNPWKRQDTSKYFSGYRCAFVVGHAWFFRVIRNFIWELPKETKIHYIVWGRKDDIQFSIYRLCAYVLKKKLKILRVEDGFVRSMGSGLLHTKACSICIDEGGVYYEAGKETDLEKIINNDVRLNNEDLLSRAASCIEIFKSARVTKYYPIEPYDNEVLVRSDRYSVLVIGQVEDDSSIKYGKCKIKKNADLVLQAKKENPKADIFFRPHPDYYHKNRKPYKTNENLEKICTIVSSTTSISKLIEQVDHVYTMTSLSGLEALILGKKVTCFGAPFYSGWGLTDDRVKIKRRTRNLNINQLFAAVYLLYPKYNHPESDIPSSFEEIVSFFVVEVLKYDNIFFPSETFEKLYKRCLPHQNELGLNFQILSEIIKSNNFAALDPGKFWTIANNGLKLHHYNQISYLLAKSSNYDLLVELSNVCISFIDNNRSEFETNTTGINYFFYSYCLNMAKTNGRALSKLPEFNSDVTSINGWDHNFNSIVKNYVHSLSNNLQYDEISDFLEIVERKIKKNNVKYLYSRKRLCHYIIELNLFGFKKSNYKDLLVLLSKKPTRSERNSNYRHELINNVSNSLANYLEGGSESTIDPYVNKLILCVYKGLLYDAQKALREIIRNFADFIDDKLLPVVQLYDRTSDMFFCAQFFAKNADSVSVFKILSMLDQHDSQASINVQLQLYLKTKQWALFYKRYSEIDRTKLNEASKVLYARALREHGFIQKSINVNYELLKTSKSLAKRSSIAFEIQKLNFLKETTAIVNSVPQPNLPRGVVLLASQTCFNTLAMLAPVLSELKKLGYAVINLCSGMSVDQKTGIPYLDQFSGIIPLDLTNYKLTNEWYVDWDNKKVVCNNLNFYQGFYEGLSGYSRRFFVDINIPFINKQFNSQLERSDLCLNICKKITSEITNRGMRTIIITGNSHVTPFSIFRDYAIHIKNPLLSFINCNASYESYYSNLGSKFANTMCVTDMTQYPHLRAPFLARNDQFEPWYHENKSDSYYLEKTQALLSMNRVGSESNDTEVKILDYIKECKSKGMKILCAFGKVPVDLNVPFDGGGAHTDMSDWITHTVNTVSKSDNLLLLVKPHPHELRPEISLDLVDSFHDLIKTEISDNIILLGHKDINGQALAPYLDLALLYNGSSGIELTAQGVPVCMASYFGKYDYPVSLIYPESREQYESFLLGGVYKCPDNETRIRAAFLLCFLGAGLISAENRYSIRPITNDKIGVPIWRKDLVHSYLRNGDANLTRVAMTIINKVSQEKINYA